MSTPLLTLEIVPKTSWGSNLRSILSKHEWDILRKAQYEKAGHRCEICGGSGLDQGYRHAVDCHEIWQYEEDAHIQKLVGLIALCPDCHDVKHFGLTQLRGPKAEARAIQHMMKVNQWTEGQVAEHIRAAVKEWELRCQYEWTLVVPTSN